MSEDARTVRKAISGTPIRRIVVEVIAGPDRGAHAELTTGTLRVGTAHGNDLRLQDPTASRFHLELRRDRDFAQESRRADR